MIDLLACKKLLAGYYEYTQALERHSPDDVLQAIKIDYGV
jgi:hypothetical protein